MPVSYHPGADITDQDVDLIVNTVNTVGVMGAGVARACRERFPEIMKPYQEVCRTGRLRPGAVQILRVHERPMILNMATKADWRHPSRYEWVGAGLVYLARYLENRQDIRSIALPPPGCGHGGLDWQRVHAMAIIYLRRPLARGVAIRMMAERPDPCIDPLFYAGVGSRKTPGPMRDICRELGRRLADAGWILRSGGADGADSAFHEGAGPDPARSRIFTIKQRPDIPHAVQDIPDVHGYMARSIHPAPDKLSPVAMRLMARNGAQVFGHDFKTPSKAVLCWTPNGSGSGGTGQAIRLAASVGIPVFDFGDPVFSGMSVDVIVEKLFEEMMTIGAAPGDPVEGGPEMQ